MDWTCLRLSNSSTLRLSPANGNSRMVVAPEGEMWAQFIRLFIKWVGITAELYISVSCMMVMLRVTRAVCFSTLAAAIMLALGLGSGHLSEAQDSRGRSFVRRVVHTLIIVIVEALSALFLFQRS